MSQRIPRAALVATILVTLLAAVAFTVLNGAFGGPSVPGAGLAGQQVTVELPDSQGLVTKSLVLVRGVNVGDVARLEPHGDAMRVTLRVARATVFRDAIVRVGHRTLFGEAYVDLVPGRAASGRLPDGARLPADRVRATVEVDEALEMLGPDARRRLGALAGTGAAVADEQRSATRLNRTLDGLAGTTDGLRRLTGALRGRDRDLAALVQSSREVVDELSSRDAQLRTVVAGGRATAEALTQDAIALRDGLGEASRLLASARGTLRAADPLLRESSPVLDRVSRAAPDVTRTLRELPAAVVAVQRTLAALPAARRAAVPTLRLVRATSPALGALVPPLQSALRNAVPIVSHLAPYKREVLGFIASGEGIRALRPDGTATSGTLADAERYRPFEAMGDPGAPYGWARFFVEGNPGALTGSGDGVGDNPYPTPGDPYSEWSGTYPRLLAEPAPAP